MPRLRIIAVLATLAILVSAAAAIGHASTDSTPAGGTRATTGKIDLALPGTAWVIERPGKVAPRHFARGWESATRPVGVSGSKCRWRCPPWSTALR